MISVRRGFIVATKTDSCITCILFLDFNIIWSHFLSFAFKNHRKPTSANTEILHDFNKHCYSHTITAFYSKLLFRGLDIYIFFSTPLS